MMQSYNSIRHIKSVLTLLMVTIFLTGCGTLADAGRPIAPSEKLWAKDGVSDVQVIREGFRQCSTENDARYKGATLNELMNIEDACMLRKGFQYVPQPKGWKNMCAAFGVFYDSIACQSTRSGFTLPPEK